MPQLTMFNGFYNTTSESGATLKKYQSVAKAQEDNIIAIFRDKSPMSPSQCHRAYEKRFGKVLLTSVRRAITRLTKSGILTKTEIKATGIYNHPEHVWKIN